MRQHGIPWPSSTWVTFSISRVPCPPNDASLSSEGLVADAFEERAETDVSGREERASVSQGGLGAVSDLSTGGNADPF